VTVTVALEVVEQEFVTVTRYDAVSVGVIGSFDAVAPAIA
jgi:hypothetical protein